jgi:hypothetical protein
MEHKSHAGNIMDVTIEAILKNPSDEPILMNYALKSMYAYAKALEFALECIGKGVRMPTDVPLAEKPKPQPMADDERRPGESLDVFIPICKVPAGTTVTKEFVNKAVNNFCGCGIAMEHRHDDVNFGAVIFDSAVETGKEPVYTEQKQLDTEHFFKDFSPENPCCKPTCSVCYPSAPKNTNP